MINEYINELVAYGLNHGLVDPEDEVYVTNRLLELFQLTEHEGTAKEVRSERELSQILNDMLELIASSAKAKEVLGWNPQYADLETIIGTAWKWHKSHPNGY